jgi:hypothetical protein
MSADVYLTDVFYQLDSQLPVDLSTGRKYEPFHNFTANIDAVPNQQHTLFLNIGLVSVYDIFGEGDPHGHFVQSVVWDANQAVLFSVNTTGMSPALNYTMRSNYAEPVYPPGATHMQTTPTPSPSNTPSSNSLPSISPTQTPTRSLIVALDSPKNQTYLSNEITVSVSASDPENQIGPGSVAYILDGNPQVVIAETPRLGLHSFTNSTTIFVSDGSHHVVGVGITWFGGADGVFFSEPVYFTAIEPSPSTTPTSTTTPSPTQTLNPSPTPDNAQDNFAPLIIAVGLVIIVGVVTLLIVWVKNRGNR